MLTSCILPWPVGEPLKLGLGYWSDWKFRKYLDQRCNQLHGGKCPIRLGHPDLTTASRTLDPVLPFIRYWSWFNVYSVSPHEELLEVDPRIGCGLMCQWKVRDRHVDRKFDHLLEQSGVNSQTGQWSISTHWHFRTSSGIHHRNHTLVWSDVTRDCLSEWWSVLDSEPKIQNVRILQS